MFVWRPCLPPKSPSSGAIPEPPPYSLDGSIQQFNEFSKGVCRVVIWRYHKIFQVRGFQKESQDRNEQHWKDVHCLFVHFSNMLWVACMAIILQHFLTLSLPLCKTILLMCWRKENFIFLWKFIIWNSYDMQQLKRYLTKFEEQPLPISWLKKMHINLSWSRVVGFSRVCETQNFRLLL